MSLNRFVLHAKSCPALISSLRIPSDGSLQAGEFQIINGGPPDDHELGHFQGKMKEAGTGKVLALMA